MPTPPRLAAPAAVLATIGALAYLWLGWCAFPLSNWNELRLAPTFALVHGVTLYPSLDGGPLSTWIYGPVGLLVNLPATLAHSAIGAVQTAGAMNLLTLVIPLAVVCFGFADLRARGWSTCLFALALSVLLLPATALQFQVADHTAIALGLLACVTLARSAGRHVLLAAALCALAIWAKQTAIFLLPALACWLWSIGERTAARRFLGWSALFGGAIFVVCGLAFGFSALWLNLVTIPAHLPWGDAADKLARRAPQLALQLGLPLVLLALLRRSGRWPARDTETGRFLGIVLCAAVASIPLGLPAFFKVGGDLNALHWWFYLVPALAAAWLARGLPPVVSLLLAVVVLLARIPEFRSLPATPQTAALAHAERIARANPGTMWFPYNPLVTYYADGRLYHVEDGIATRHLAGLGLREASFRRYLPARLTAVVYPAYQTDFFALQLLPEFDRRLSVGAWTVFTRAPK